MFDTLKIENRYTFRNDDELSVRSLSIYGDKEKKEKILGKISEENNESSSSCDSSTEEEKEQNNNDKSETNDSLVQKFDEINDENTGGDNESVNKDQSNILESQNQDSMSENDNDSDVQEKIEIIKNDDKEENEMNAEDEKDDKEIDDIENIITPESKVQLTDTQYEILENIGNLCNHILSNSASKTLIR